jgi:hypothetical protein
MSEINHFKELLGSNSRGLLDPEYGKKYEGGLAKDGERRCKQLVER